MAELQANEEQPPTLDTSGIESEDQKADDSQNKVSELMRILDSYFDEDPKLRMSYKSERSVDDLFSLPQVKLLEPTKEELMAAASQCKKLILDQDKVRANVSQGRTTLILRDLPKGVSYNLIKSLMEAPQLTQQLGSKVKSIQPELNETWFVRFATEEDCLKTAEWLTFEGAQVARTIMGTTVKCRVKSVLPTSTFNPGGQPTGVRRPNYGMDPYASSYGGFNGFYGMPPSPNFMPFGMPPSPNMTPFSGNRGKKSQRRNSNRGQGRGRGTDRQQSTRGSPQHLPRQPSNRPKRQKSRKQNQADDDDIFYKGQFVLVERTSFDAIVKQAQVQDMNEPVKPEALRNLPDLCTETHKEGFYQPSWGSGRTISPYPPAQASPADPPSMSLDDNKGSEKPETMKVKPKKNKKKGSSKKKKQKAEEAPKQKTEAKTKTSKNVADVDADQKENSPEPVKKEKVETEI